MLDGLPSQVGARHHEDLRGQDPLADARPAVPIALVGGDARAHVVVHHSHDLRIHVMLLERRHDHAGECLGVRRLGGGFEGAVQD
jgi:hypothetical protein